MWKVILLSLVLVVGVDGQWVNSKTTEAPPVDVFEGDIVMTKKLQEYIDRKKSNPDSEDSPFDAILNGQWPQARVPYTFATGFRYGSAVQSAKAAFKKYTCIRLEPKTSRDRNYVEFMHGGGCYSMIGKQGGKQQISLGNGCGTTGVAIHEIMHALGFFHEQSRRDRDKHITVNFKNINRRMWYNFEKYRSGQASTLGEPYDKNSVMHYGNYAFSINGQKTIVSKSNPNERLGQRNGLSRIDINQLNKYYQCAGTKTTQKPQPPTGGCKDVYEFCPIIANRYCTRYTWVKTNCKKSCQSSSKAVDLNKDCAGWAKHVDYCPYPTGCCDRNSKYADYMKKNCQKSCGAKQC